MPGILAAELTGAPAWPLWAGGVSLLVGRLMRAAILILKGWGLPRATGMILTFVPMPGFASGASPARRVRPDLPLEPTPTGVALAAQLKRLAS